MCRSQTERHRKLQMRGQTNFFATVCLFLVVFFCLAHPEELPKKFGAPMRVFHSPLRQSEPLSALARARLRRKRDFPRRWADSRGRTWRRSGSRCGSLPVPVTRTTFTAAGDPFSSAETTNVVGEHPKSGRALTDARCLFPLHARQLLPNRARDSSSGGRDASRSASTSGRAFAAARAPTATPRPLVEAGRDASLPPDDESRARFGRSYRALRGRRE